jgi:hypothetical protein
MGDQLLANLSIACGEKKCSDFDETITNRLEMPKSEANLVSDRKVDFSRNW